MTTVTFDTLAYAERLKSGGFTDEQAKAEAEALSKVLSDALDSQLATKADIAHLDKQLLVLKWMLGIVIAVEVLPFLKTVLA